MDVGKRIISFRKAHKWTQDDLSDKTGISQPRISRIEKNKSPARVLEAEKFAAAFGVTTSELFNENITLQRNEVILKVEGG